jgi:DNA mismatch repair protein MutL
MSGAAAFAREPAPSPLPQVALPYTVATPATTHAMDAAPVLASPATQALSEAAPQSSPYRALAQTKRLYIVAESTRGIAIIDQHAADERIKFDRLKRQLDARKIALQRLLIAERVELSEREAAIVESCREQIEQAGVEATLIGPTTAAVHAVPALLRRASPERLLRDLIHELSRAGDRGYGDALDMALATMACHGAIRAGDALSVPECQALLEGLAQIEAFSGHCPHGRPVVLEMSFDELSRKVGR